MAKSIIGFLETLFEYFIFIVNVNFFSNLKFEYYCEYYPEILQQVSLNNNLKLMGGAMKYFLEKFMGHEIFRSMVSWAMKFLFLENL